MRDETLHGFGNLEMSQIRTQIHPRTLIEMWIICLDPVSANSEKGRGSEWAVRVGLLIR